MKHLNTRDPGFEADFAALLDEARETTAAVGGAVAEIIAAIRARGDAALVDYTARFDGWQPGLLRVTADELAEAEAAIAPDLLAALDLFAGFVPILLLRRDPATGRLLSELAAEAAAAAPVGRVFP